MHTVNLYDFDGVLASPFEEALFTLPPTDRDAKFVKAVKQNIAPGLRLDHESPTSQRYIALQCVLWHNRYPVEHGPITPEIGVPFNILTARCDLYAVRRMHEYVTERIRSVRPVKTMHLDHLPKGLIIEVLLDRHPETHFKFWDDNPRHIESALSLKSDRLEVFHVDNDMDDVYTEAESFYQNLVSQWI